MPQLTTQELFRELDGRSFKTDRELQEAVLPIFNRHLAEMPPGYYFTELIEWGRQKKWIQRTAEGYVVALEPRANGATR